MTTTEKVQHTPGPWKMRDANCDDGPHSCGIQAYDHEDNHEEGWIVADINSDVPNALANARLIATAPELLEALESLVGLIQSSVAVYGAKQIEWLTGKPSFKNAQAVIRKARGLGIGSVLAERTNP